jgi:hypothetical protein
MKYLALTLPGGQTIQPKGLPTGGLPAVSTFVNGAITMFLIVGVITCLAFLIWGGMQWTASGGDKAKVAAARSRITFAIVGLLVMLLSFGILGVMATFFGVQGGLLNFSGK